MPTPYRTRAEIILIETSRRHNITAGAMVGPARDKELIQARREAAFRLRRETTLSYPQIGRRFNKTGMSAYYMVRDYCAQIGEPFPIGPTCPLKKGSS